MPQVTETIVDVPVPQHLEQVVEQGVPVPMVTDEIIQNAQLIPQDRILLRSVQEVMFLYPQIQEQIADWVHAASAAAGAETHRDHGCASASDHGENRGWREADFGYFCAWDR